MSIYELLPILYGREEEAPSFTPFSVKDVNAVSGRWKRRRANRPNSAMTDLHKRFVKHLRGLPVDLTYATACKPGSSIVSDVAQHRYARWVYATDVKSAFQSVSLKGMTDVLGELEPEVDRETICGFLEKYCFEKEPARGLIFGSPSSNDLFNIYLAQRVDCYLAQRLLQVTNLFWRATYTRYLDDLKVSVCGEIARFDWDNLRKYVRYCVEAAGLTINHWKTRNVDLWYKGRPQCVNLNGVGIEYGGRLYLPGHYRDALRDEVERYLHGDPLSEIAFKKLQARMQHFDQIMRANPQGPSGTERALIEKYKILVKRIW